MTEINKILQGDEIRENITNSIPIEIRRKLANPQTDEDIKLKEQYEKRAKEILLETQVDTIRKIILNGKFVSNDITMEKVITLFVQRGKISRIKELAGVLDKNNLGILLKECERVGVPVDKIQN